MKCRTILNRYTQEVTLGLHTSQYANHRITLPYSLYNGFHSQPSWNLASTITKIHYKMDTKMQVREM